jgi:hypothetical protein
LPEHVRCRTAPTPDAPADQPHAAIGAIFSWSSQYLTSLARALGHRRRPPRHGGRPEVREPDRRQRLRHRPAFAVPGRPRPLPDHGRSGSPRSAGAGP